MKLNLQDLAPGRPGRPGPAGRLRGGRRRRGHVVPGDARRAQRAARSSHGEEPVAFDHDCREGICGACGMVINGEPHGPQKATTTCQLHMRHFRDGETITVEPWRAAAFPVVKDLVVDRSAFDRIIAAGGYISAPTGARPRRTPTPGAEGERRPRVHRRRVHRLRGVRRGLPERLGLAVPRRQDHSPRRAAAGAAGASDRVVRHGRRRTTQRASAAAPTPASARWRARRRSRST